MSNFQLNISKVLAPKNVDVSPVLQEELRQARAELQRVKSSGPGSGEYAFFIKTMRAEQKIKDLEEKYHGERKLGQLKSASTELVVNYVVKAVLYISLVTLSIRNRYNPVLIYSEQFNLEPLQGLLTFPTGIPNSISVPVWVLSCNITFRLISSLIQ